ncbi:hypothetical protein FACS189498_1270 [Spirochaetia bacterium]|nr:hypothetical protein FACS189498_1270 [Spirochaetia bacterium]
MILSASRRTDIPAFFGEWFINCLREKEVFVKNPVNPKSVSRIILDPALIDCIVFWTKNPRDFIRRLGEIEDLGYTKYYFQFTLNSYGDDLEKNLPPKGEIIETFLELSERIGKQRVIWRYDPVIVNDKYSVDFHVENFRLLYEKLSKNTEKCVISFVDRYKFLAKTFTDYGIAELSGDDINKIAAGIGETVNSGGQKLEIASCCEKVDLSSYGIGHNRCIDGDLIQKLFGSEGTSKKGEFKKDPGQRQNCGCAASRDLGTYNTCGHGCVYCYAGRGMASQ